MILVARRRHSSLRSRTRFWRPLTALAVASLFGFPIVYTVISAFKTPAESSSLSPTLLPTEWSLENFAQLRTGGTFLGTFVLNSVALTSLTVALTVLVAVPAGYAFSKLRFPFRRWMFALALAVLLVPAQALMVGLFSVLIGLRLTNSYVGLALVYTTIQLPFAIFMMRNSFDSIPRELGEAAVVDGCSTLSLLPRLYLRLVWPGVVTIALFAFINSWNEFFIALVALNDNNSYTLPVALVNAYTGPYNTIDWGALQAGVTVTMVPCILIFALLQRYYVSGLISGAVK